MLGTILRCWLLCQQLGDEDCPTRDYAQRELTGCGVYALPALLFHQHSADPEIRKRCRELLEPFSQQATIFGTDLAAVWILYGPAFEDADGLLTWFYSEPEQVRAVIALADRRGILAAEWATAYLSRSDWHPWRVPLWYRRLRWATEGGR